MDAFNYQMTWAAWSGSLYKDPEPMWASREAERAGGNNITGLRNPAIDALIEQQKSLFDVEQRHAICRRIDALAAAEVPYVLLWNLNYVRLLYWNKFGMPDWVLSKYGDERSAYWYWWYDPDSAADLEQSMKQGTALPARNSTVSFDGAFKP
jgi:microcin C transport system substrate-binding protein